MCKFRTLLCKYIRGGGNWDQEIDMRPNSHHNLRAISEIKISSKSIQFRKFEKLILMIIIIIFEIHTQVNLRC